MNLYCLFIFLPLIGNIASMDIISADSAYDDAEDFDGNEDIDAYIERMEAEENGHFTLEYNNNPNLIELALQLNLTTCVDNLKKAGIDKVINHEGSFTLFCPIDDAFEREKIYPGEDTLIDKMRLHVARGMFKSEVFQNEMTFKSLLSKRTVRMNVYTAGTWETLTANGRGVIETDHVARNGVIHILYDVMSSVYDREGSVISEIDECCPQHSQLLELVNYAGLYHHLDTYGPFTFLAPLNGAFAKLHPDFIIHLKKNMTLLREILKSHVIPGTWYTPGLSNNDVLKSLSLNKIVVHKDNDGGVKFGSAVATLTDVTAVNGAVHSIDSVIFPKIFRPEIDQIFKNIAKKVETTEARKGQKNLVALCEDLGLTTFVEQLKKFNVDKVMNHEGSFTLFAPTNEAFLKPYLYPVDFNTRDTILFHIARGEITDDFIYNDLSVKSLLSHRNININIYKTEQGRVITANGRVVELTEHRAHNGIVHILHEVMYSVPERDGTLLEEINRSEDHTFFAEALNKTGLAHLLDEKDTFTAFVPTNKAFYALGKDMLEKLSNDPILMADMVLLHLVQGTYYTKGMDNGKALRTLLGERIHITKDSGEVLVNNVPVSIPDWCAINGAFHTIQHVLFQHQF